MLALKLKNTENELLKKKLKSLQVQLSRKRKFQNESLSITCQSTQESIIEK